jgi:hypothetical protein
VYMDPKFEQMMNDPLRFEPQYRALRNNEAMQERYKSSVNYTEANNSFQQPRYSTQGPEASTGLRNKSTRDLVSSQIMNSGMQKSYGQESFLSQSQGNLRASEVQGM